MATAQASRPARGHRNAHRDNTRDNTAGSTGIPPGAGGSGDPLGRA